MGIDMNCSTALLGVRVPPGSRTNKSGDVLGFAWAVGGDMVDAPRPSINLTVLLGI